MKTRITKQRWLAIFLSLFMIMSLFNGLVLTTVEAAELRATQNTTRMADPNTMDDYDNKLISDEWGSRYAGRLWGDKSVVSSDESGVATIELDKKDGYIGTVSTEADFSHVFSTVGSSQVLNDETKLPLDVVFVLDTSSTMARNWGAPDELRLFKAGTALNRAFSTLAEVSPDSRFALVRYDTDATVALPLDQYEPLSSEGYIKVTDIKTNNAHRGYSLNVRSKSTKEEFRTNYGIDSGTNTHQGLYEGLNILKKETETTKTVYTENGVEVLQRIPVVILLSDGEPSIVTTEVGKLSERHHVDNDPIQTGEITNWWEPINPTKVAADKPDERSGAGFVGCPSGHSWGTAIPVYLMAAHMKQEVSMNYFGTTTPKNYPGTQIITVGVDPDAEVDKKRVELMKATLNPSSQLTEEHYQEIKNVNEDNRNIYTKYIYESLERYLNPEDDLSNFRLIVDEHKNWSTIERPEKSDNVNTIDWNGIRYNDRYLDAEADNLGNVLVGLVNEISTLGSVFTPVSGTNEAGVTDSVTYVDPIGDYMEIKNSAITINRTNSDMSLLLFGQMYSLDKTATLVNGEVSENSNGLTTEQFKALIPTLKDGMDEKEANTIYNLYQFYNADNVNDWYLNPAYVGRIQDLKGPNEVDKGIIPDYDKNFRMSEELQEFYTKDPSSVPNGVYRLSDIVVWVEDTGDYKDVNPGAESSGGLFNGVGFDQALYVNIPANALPLQVAEVELDETHGVSKYKTNLKETAQSAPLRLFYAVGIQDKIKAVDGSVDLTKVSQTYLDSHKDENGNVYFTSNYFTAGENNAEDQSQGDAVVTFSPSDDNRYYIFQKALPIYTKAYQKVNGQLVEINDANWEGGVLAGIYNNKDEANNIDEYKVALVGTLNEGITEKNENDIFFFAIEYYKDGSLFSNGEQVQYVIPRTGNQLLAKDYSNLHRTDMLAWLNTNDQVDSSDLIRAYDTQNPTSPGEGWILATNPGGLRVADLISEEKSENITDTANNSYTPIISKGSDSNNIMVKMYLGNNGVLTVEDDLLLVTKMVENEEGQYDPNNTTEFSYDLSVEGFKGARSAVKVIRDEEANTWRRVIGSIDAVTDNSGLLHSVHDNDKLAQVGYSNGVVDLDGTGYYIYVHDENVIGATTVYSYTENIGTKEQEGDIIKFLTNVELVSVESGNSIKVDNFVIATMDTNSGINSSEITLHSNYYIRSKYLTDDNIDFDMNGNATISLKSGEGLLFNSIGNRTKYTVTENLSNELVEAGWRLKSVNGQTESKEAFKGQSYVFNNTEHKYSVSGITGLGEVSVDYINTNNFEIPGEDPELPEIPKVESGNLTINKIVTGTTEKLDQQFHFNITLDDDSINGVYGDITFVDGSAEFTLTHGQNKTAKGLPVDVSYKVTELEANQDGFTTSTSGDSGKIIKDTTNLAVFINAMDYVKPEEGTGNLTVSKTVRGKETDNLINFNFIVTLNDKTINGEYGAVTFVDGKATFVLSHGESKTIRDLPAGISYTVQEVEANQNGFQTTVIGKDNIVVAGETQVIAFLNEKADIIIEDTKDPEVLDPDNNQSNNSGNTQKPDQPASGATIQPSTADQENTYTSSTITPSTEKAGSTSTNSVSTTSPKTGVSNYLLIVFVVLMVLAIVSLVIVNKRRHKDQ